MTYDHRRDGIDHINILFHGRTILGRMLSNFHFAPIKTQDGWFATIEGYWYWLSTHDERLRYLPNGYACKKLGRELRGKDWSQDHDFCNKIRRAISQKIWDYPSIRDLLKASGTKTLTHYYIFPNPGFTPKVVMVPESQWIVNHIVEIRWWLQTHAI